VNANSEYLLESLMSDSIDGVSRGCETRCLGCGSGRKPLNAE